MKSGHDKDPCDSVGGTTKQKADIAMKNGKAVIQDANNIRKSTIKFYFITFTDYDNAANFFTNGYINIRPVAETMKLHYSST